VRRAGVTRGALYHHFRDKQDLFRVVFEQTEAEIMQTIIARVEGIGDPMEELATGVRAFLDACDDPTLMRIGLRDAPGVLGWEEWRAIGEQFGLGTAMALLGQAMDEGAIARQPVRPLAHVVIGALDEAALYVARAEDRTTARAEMDSVLARLIDGLR
jgi:AcrR family transcriptional regulator